MMRRLQVVHFRRIFAEHEIDRQLFKRIATNELSGVLNRALEGWKRLQTRCLIPGFDGALGLPRNVGTSLIPRYES